MHVSGNRPLGAAAQSAHPPPGAARLGADAARRCVVRGCRKILALRIESKMIRNSDMALHGARTASWAPPGGAPPPGLGWVEIRAPIPSIRSMRLRTSANCVTFRGSCTAPAILKPCSKKNWYLFAGRKQLPEAHRSQSVVLCLISAAKHL